MYYYRARYYDASIGRFLQVDPDAGVKLNPATHVNKYIYTLNNPINRIDPLGEFSLKRFAKSIVSLDAASIFDQTARAIVDINRGIGEAFGFQSLMQMQVNYMSFGQIKLSMSEKNQVRLTKAALIVVMGSMGMESGLLTGKGIAGIATLSGYQASGQDGSWTDNFLNNMGGNMALAMAAEKGVSFLPDTQKWRVGAAAIGGISLGYSIIDATIKINKKYKVR